MSRLALILRSSLFAFLIVLATMIWAPLCFLFAPLPFRLRYYWTTRWNVFVIWAARVVCGIRYQVKGFENLPDGPAILLPKHQSAWETIFLITLMPRPLVYVFKREILYIPFFGWGIALLRMIPIDRSKGKDALRSVIEAGVQRLASGLWIVMFPEGTRSAVGTQGKYKGGGAVLAAHAQVPAVPIALNSGECWPRHAFIKKPGLITVSIGKPIDTVGKSASDILQATENWIESEMRVISPHAYAKP